MAYTILFMQCGSDHMTYGRSGYRPDHIAVHFTATQASARNNVIYFSRNQGQGASAHYFIDDISPEIYQSVRDSDTAWAVGDWNMNCRSISIEVVSSGEDFSAVEIDKLSWLVQTLMKKYGIPWGRVIRHYDVNGKRCPAPYIDEAKWAALRAQITGGPVSGGSNPRPPAQSGGNHVPVTYELRKLGGQWLGAVTDFNNTDSDGFAGLPCNSHDLLVMSVNEGAIRYRSHVLNGGWQSWITRADKSDTLHGCAGVHGKAIDGVQAYYTTPDGRAFMQVWYRSQTTKRSGWLDVCCDDGTSIDGFDGWAGMYGEPLDRLQVYVGDANPF